MIRVRGLSKRFGGVAVLSGVDLDVGEGEIVCVTGPSGSGKTTLLRCLGGLETIDSGTVTVGGVTIAAGAKDGAALAKLRAKTGIVFQQFHLFPHLTAIGNVTLAPRFVRKESPAEARAAGERLLALVGLKGLEERYPSELSGGQQQRVAIARSLAMEPRVLLYDEPTSSLDPDRKTDVLEVMRRLRDRRITQVVVTHDLEFARSAADRVETVPGTG